MPGSELDLADKKPGRCSKADESNKSVSSPKGTPQRSSSCPYAAAEWISSGGAGAGEVVVGPLACFQSIPPRSTELQLRAGSSAKRKRGRPV